MSTDWERRMSKLNRRVTPENLAKALIEGHDGSVEKAKEYAKERLDAWTAIGSQEHQMYWREVIVNLLGRKEQK